MSLNKEEKRPYLEAMMAANCEGIRPTQTQFNAYNLAMMFSSTNLNLWMAMKIYDHMITRIKFDHKPGGAI